MILNYLKLSFRLVVRNPYFTFINVPGLSIGLTAFYILRPYAQSELKSDQFHKGYDQIARLPGIIHTLKMKPTSSASIYLYIIQVLYDSFCVIILRSLVWPALFRNNYSSPTARVLIRTFMASTVAAVVTRATRNNPVDALKCE